MALFSILEAEDLIRRLLDRWPKLRRIIIKSNFRFPRFLVLWNDLQIRFRDVPRVAFKLECLSGEDRYADTSPGSTHPSVRLRAWQNMMQASLEGADRLWEESEQVSSVYQSLRLYADS